MPAYRILLVEDDAVLRDLLWRNLQARGYAVRLAEDAQSALAELRTTSIDLVVLDINLPDQSGWDVLRIALRERIIPSQALQEEREQLPVIVLSAVRVSLTRLHEFPLLAYLPKPFPMDALLRLIAERAQGMGERSTEVLFLPMHEEEKHA